MRESKTGVASDRVRQVLAGGIHHRRTAGSCDAIAAHELRIGHGITAVTRTLLRYGWGLRAIQDSGNLLGDFTLENWESIRIKIALPGEAGALQIGVHHF